MAASFGKRGVAAPRAVFATAAPAAVPHIAPPAPASRAATPLSRVPLATIAIIVVLTLVFMAEMKYAVVRTGTAPSVGALVAFGAVDGGLVLQHGEWWRLFTAPLLHANLTHLISNVAVFAIIGFMLEPLVGSRWFAALYAAGAIGGSLCSIVLNEPDIPCIGASGAIMGVLGGAFICGASHKAGPKGRKMQTWALRLILPSLIPMAADSHVDYAGHLGGVLGGIFMGVVLQLVWSKGEDRPALGEAAAGMAATVFAIGLASLLLFAQFGSAAAVAAAAAPGMIPDDQLPRDDHTTAEQASDLVTRYPHDPRAHFFRGIAFITEGHDLADAEEQFRQALNPTDLAAARLDAAFGKAVTVLLSVTVAHEHRLDEARAIAAPVCGFAQESMSEQFDDMRDTGICGD